MKYVVFFLIILSLPVTVYSEKTTVLTFSLRIPPIAGVNVPNNSEVKSDMAGYTEDKEVIREKTIRDGEELILETVVPN